MLDRTLQRQILELLRHHYPRGAIPVRDLHLSAEQAAANRRYLEEQGLCESGVVIGADGPISFGESTITAAGIDFLADDGGLSAIRSVLTIKLHADTIRSLIESRIEASPIPDKEKSIIRKAVANLSEAALKTATTDLVKNGLDHLPDVIRWLRSLAGV